MKPFLVLFLAIGILGLFAIILGLLGLMSVELRWILQIWSCKPQDRERRFSPYGAAYESDDSDSYFSRPTAAAWWGPSTDPPSE